MKIYSDYPGRAMRQALFDALALISIMLWVWLGVELYRLVSELRVYGEKMQTAGAGIRGTMSDIGETLGGVPFIGGGIREPFDAASAAGAELESAGVSQQEAVHQLALGLGFGLAVLPVVTILVFWLVPRLRFVRRSSTARNMALQVAGTELLALRAIANQKLGALARIDADVAGKWRAGDPAIIRKLAELELRASGVRLPAEQDGGATSGVPD
ncbi:hypothetical protein [Demequina sp.]|uniref:hypothetical protein n=1 Tax=Demequina sp. TaxID=2050685 RepID=UPI0025BB7B50|nr:hypothetical protein [Demequina sp.]